MATTVDLNDLLTTKEAAKVLGVKPNTLEIWRHKGKGPPFIRLGEGPCAPIRYLRAALKEFCDRQTFTSTSAYSPAAMAYSKQHNRSPISASG